MGRWDPDAGGRLVQAAMALYLERGYDAVTTAEIAERAGLTKRSYFRYFPDKREVLFADALSFERGIVDAVTAAPEAVAPLDAVVRALAAAGAELARYGQFAKARRDLIRSSTDLQERELIKTASLATAVAAALRERGVPARQATLTAHAGVVAFTTAYDEWIDTERRSSFPTVLRRTVKELRRAVEGG